MINSHKDRIKFTRLYQSFKTEYKNLPTIKRHNACLQVLELLLLVATSPPMANAWPRAIYASNTNDKPRNSTYAGNNIDE